MEIKGLIVKSIGQSEETHSCGFENFDTLEDFKVKLLEVANCFDVRLLEIINRIIEDGNFERYLTPHQNDILNRLVLKLFCPDRLGAENSKDYSKLQFQLQKATAPGEQVTIQLHKLETEKSLVSPLLKAWRILDARVEEMNARKLAHDELFTAQSDEDRMTLQFVLDALFGMRNPVHVEESLKGHMEEIAERGENGYL